MYLINYDITDNKTRRKMVSILEDYGIRVQKSVFESDITERQLLTLHKELQNAIKDDEDEILEFFS